MALFNSYLNKDNVFEAYKKARAYMRSSHEPLDEFERVAKNQPHPSIDKAYPKVTDGTASSIVQKTPRRIIQQIPTGRVKGEGWLPVVADFIYREVIIPNANEQFALLQKCWMQVQRAMSYGASHSITPFVNRGEYFGPDMSIPYIKNVLYEAGKLSDQECNCIFVEMWYQTADIERIIEKEKELAKQAKERGEKYEATWDLKALEEIKDKITAKTEEEDSVNKTNDKDDTHKGGVKLVLALQKGLKAEFYTFHPQSETIVRTKENKDPRGEMPLQSMYFETDGINPLGRGLIEQVISLQNLLDSEVQMYQFNRALMLAPPLIKKGTWASSKAKLVPNILIDLGQSPDNSLQPLTIDTSAIQNFPANYGLIKSQILNMAASPDTSISAEVGNPGFSKTPAGVKQQQGNVSVDDNYIRKQFETWFERWSETAINLYFAERTGIEELQLDKETAQRLRDIDEELVSEDNTIIIDYDTATEALKFEVDASTSNMKNDAQQLEALDGLLERVQRSPLLQQIIPQDKIIGAWNAIVTASGVEDPEKLSVSKEELEEQELQAQQMAEAEQAELLEAQASPDLSNIIEGEVVEPQPEEPAPKPQEDELDEETMAFAIALQDMGYSDDQILQADAMMTDGYDEEEVMEMLEATRNPEQMEAING